MHKKKGGTHYGRVHHEDVRESNMAKASRCTVSIELNCFSFSNVVT